VNERNEEQRHEEVLNMATRDTTGTVGNSTGSGLGASSTGSTSFTPDSSTTGSVRDSVSKTVDQVKQEAETEGNRLVGAARTRARTAFEHQQHRVAESIGSVAQALHQAADKLNEQNEDVVARYTDTAAQRIEQFADSLRNRNLDDLVGQAEQFARRQPEVFLGSAVAAGFLIARFLRTSGGRATQRRSNLNYGGTGSYGGQNRYSQQGGQQSGARGTSYGSGAPDYANREAGNRSYTGGTGTSPSTNPPGTSGVSGAGAAGSTTGISGAASPASTGAAGNAMERNTGVLGTSERAERSSTSLGSAVGGMSPVPGGNSTPSSTVKPDDKAQGSTPPRGTHP
jgi:hypothetical protein